MQPITESKGLAGRITSGGLSQYFILFKSENDLKD